MAGCGYRAIRWRVAPASSEDKEQVRTYLRAETGNHYDADRIEAFLEAAPHMVDFYERHTALQFIDGNRIPDMHGDLPGAALGGRSVCAAPFDGRQLGPLIHKLRPPLPEISFFGMGIASGADLNHFMNVTRSAQSFVHVGRRFASTSSTWPGTGAACTS